MLKRIITAAVALAVFIGVLLLPPIVFTIALAAVIMLMLYECYTATKADCKMRVVGFISAALLILTMGGVGGMKSLGFIFIYIAATMVLLLYMALAIFEHGKRSYKDVLSSGFLTMYIAVAMWCIIYIKDFFGVEVMLLVFISAWSCDTFAYFSGYFLGRHKLIPHVSPKKTIEGSIGGVLGAVACCTVYLFILSKLTASSVSEFSSIAYTFNKSFLIWYMGAGLLGGIFSQFGDLAASAIKRDEGIKDFGWIFPGHGGFLDRFDSILYVAPIILMWTVFCQTLGLTY